MSKDMISASSRLSLDVLHDQAMAREVTGEFGRGWMGLAGGGALALAPLATLLPHYTPLLRSTTRELELRREG